MWAKDAELVRRVRQFLGENFHWHDRLAKSGTDLNVVQTLQDMVRGGSVVVMPEDRPRSGSAGVSASAPARRETFHEMVMEKMGLSAAAAWDYVDWYNDTVTRLDEAEEARKGIAKTVDASNYANASTPLSDAGAFEYRPDVVSGKAQELAASTNNPNYAAKMRGYDRDTFGDMIHAMKSENGLKGDDIVIWHDNGDVHFNGMKIDNMHNY